MNVFVVALLIGAAYPDAAVSGHVSGQGGQPLSSARVFLEPGLGGSLIETPVASDGSFEFDTVPFGLVGIFAIADGCAFGGLSRTIAVNDSATGLIIALQPEDTVAGRVTDMKGNPVNGAQITRALIMGASPVGIPFAKLRTFGFDEPGTDDSGRFVIPKMPRGGAIAFKVGHPSYAQSSVQDVRVGSRDVHVQLSPGVLVQGTVLSRDGERAVANAAIILRSATPPHDTAVATTGMSGDFSIKLNPGYYLYQAACVELRSPGWEKLTVTGREPAQRVTLRVAGTARLTGDVRDAVTGRPVPGARLALVAFGSPVAVVTTGTSGAYEFVGAEGENTLRVEAAPGFSPPARPFLTLQVKQGEDTVLPTFWLAPLPAYRIQVIDDTKAPVPGVLVRLIRPEQYACYVTNDEGRVSVDIAALPRGGKVVGLAEHPSRPLAALFSLNRDQGEEARVQLLPLASLEGAVVNGKGKPLEGAIVGGLFQADTDDEPLQLWRTVTAKDGTFVWNAIVPYVPMACLASTGPETFGRSMPFNLEPSGKSDVGRIVIGGEEKAARKSKTKSLLGTKLTWFAGNVLAGSVPGPDERAGKPALVLYTPASDAPVMLQMLTSAKAALPANGTIIALVVDGPFSGGDSPVPVVQGAAPGPATTYLMDGSGVVVLETWGLPPMSAIASVSAGT